MIFPHAKKPFIVVGTVALLFLGIMLGVTYLPKFLIKKTTVSIGKAAVTVEISNTPSAREIGLMYRKYLEPNSGMLFIFPNESRYSFWMKNTFIPLDIIWISADKKIVHLEKNVQPCKKFSPLQDVCPTLSPAQNVLYVLEVNAGWVDKNAINIGDEVFYDKIFP